MDGCERANLWEGHRHADSKTHPRNRNSARSILERLPPGCSLHEGQAEGSFNVSVAELDDAMGWNRATIGMAAISNSTIYLTGQMTAIDVAAHRIVAGLSAEILDSYSELVGD